MTLIEGDCREVMANMEECSVDAIVTDPPYGIRFMERDWDHGVPGIPFWLEALRVLKPGGYLLAFGGTRTYHRLTCAIEDTGFEIRDSIHWVYGSGFPKSLNVSKAIDKAAGSNRELVKTRMTKHSTAGKGISNELDERPWMTEARKQGYHEHDGPNPVTDLAKKYDGYGTALKPAHEPILLCRKPPEGTMAANVEKWGTGGVNVDGCRVGVEKITTHSRGHNQAFPKRPGETTVEESGRAVRQDINLGSVRIGRWPPNLVLSPEAAEEMDRQSRHQKSGVAVQRHGKGQWIGGAGTYSGTKQNVTKPDVGYGDAGGASRFFPIFKYQAKAPRKERDKGLNGERCIHPTVKPVELMRWLVRLVTPPEGIVLDPFMGSGTTGIAAIQEGFDFIGIEIDPEYLEIARLRIAAHKER